MAKELGASVDAVFKGKAFGQVAASLLANDMNVNALRTNTVLRKDEWKEMDDTVVQISLSRLVGVNDLVSRGLVYNVAEGLGTTVLEYEDVSDMADAEVNIDGSTPTAEDRLKFSIGYLPLPIVHRDFRISARVLAASRRKGQPLDTMQAAVASRKVAEKIESILFTGASTYTFGGGTLYGYTDFPDRNTGDLTDEWDQSSADPVADVLNMKQDSINAKHYGPWILYVPPNYETVLDQNYEGASTTMPITIRERILKIGGIEDVKVADSLGDDDVVLVELSPETARMVIGLQPTTVEWDSQGGMLSHFKVMAIMVPQLRSDQDGNCGIVHYDEP